MFYVRNKTGNQTDLFAALMDLQGEDRHKTNNYMHEECF